MKRSKPSGPTAPLPAGRLDAGHAQPQIQRPVLALPGPRRPFPTAVERHPIKAGIEHGIQGQRGQRPTRLRFQGTALGGDVEQGQTVPPQVQGLQKAPAGLQKHRTPLLDLQPVGPLLMIAQIAGDQFQRGQALRRRLQFGERFRLDRRAVLGLERAAQDQLVAPLIEKPVQAAIALAGHAVAGDRPARVIDQFQRHPGLAAGADGVAAGGGNLQISGLLASGRQLRRTDDGRLSDRDRRPGERGADEQDQTEPNADDSHGFFRRFLLGGTT